MAAAALPRAAFAPAELPALAVPGLLLRSVPLVAPVVCILEASLPPLLLKLLLLLELELELLLLVPLLLDYEPAPHGVVRPPQAPMALAVRGSSLRSVLVVLVVPMVPAVRELLRVSVGVPLLTLLLPSPTARPLAALSLLLLSVLAAAGAAVIAALPMLSALPALGSIARWLRLVATVAAPLLLCRPCRLRPERVLLLAAPERAPHAARRGPAASATLSERHPRPRSQVHVV